MSKKSEAKASQNDFWSVDSQPEKLSGPVAIWRAPALMVTFVLLCGGGLFVLQHGAWLHRVFPAGDWVFVPVRDQHFIAIRHCLVSFFVAFALYCNGSWRARLNLLFSLVGLFFGFCAILDFTAFGFYHITGVLPDLNVQQIAAGLMGFAIFAAQVFRRGAMPEAVSLQVTPRRQRTVFWRFWIAVGLSAYLSYYVSQIELKIVSDLRGLALLGGLGPGVFLFLPTLYLLLYLMSQWDRQWERRDVRFRPPLTIVIPAHNEAYIIADTLLAIDRAAAQYGGDVNVLVVNNNSTDRTRAVALDAFRRTGHVLGRVINEARAGKANALNRVFSEVETEFVIRIDADTQIERNALWRAMSHFADPCVGCLGGVPFTRGRSFFERARQAEVFVNHGYYAIGTDALEALVAVPGMFAVYRTELTRALGGFAFGLNGEDSDMSMRIGELGYRVMVDPKVRYESEVPATLHHMREQRMRWFRSAFHIAARCEVASQLHKGSIRGIVILPLMLLNTAMRAMTLCLIAFGLIEYFDPFTRDLRPQLNAIAAVMLGAPFLVSVMATCINKTGPALLYLPEYTLFRLFRSYYTMESLLSIAITLRSRKAKAPVALPPLEFMRAPSPLPPKSALRPPVASRGDQQPKLRHKWP
ncbi:MAG: glycosyltransferase family 2 protein [Shimia sp.]|nr:glycosyltransferase family 2 protein [Shimia sp.]